MEHSCEGPPLRGELWGPLSPKPHHKWKWLGGGEKKMPCAGRIPSPCPFACAPVRWVLLSRSGRSPVRSVSIPPDCLWHQFEGNPTLCKKSFKHCSCVATSLRERICSRVCEQHSQSFLAATLTRVSLYSSEHQQPGLFGLALGVLEELRAARGAGWLWEQGEVRGWVGGAHQERSSESWGCLQFQNKYIDMLWVPSRCNSHPIPWGVWNTLNHARLFVYIFVFLCLYELMRISCWWWMLN